MTVLSSPTTSEEVPGRKRRAFVVFLMFNDSYLSGALMAAYGLKRQRSKSQRVCVVTPEISDNARQMLAELYDKIVEIDPIGVPDGPAGDDRVQIRTGSARLQSAALTRFASLRLGPDGDLGCAYEKLVVIDADLLPIRDFEQLWALPAPAGIINEYRSHMVETNADGSLLVRPKSLRTGKWGWHDIYDPICPPGSLIPQEITDRVAQDHDNYGVNASLVVLRPSMATFNDFMRWVATPAVLPLVRDHWSWVDQQAATLYWSGSWTNVDASYSTFYGYPSLDVARGLHFAGIKPWSWRKKGFQRRLELFPDYRLWSVTYLDMLDDVPAFRNHAGLRRLGSKLELALAEAG